MSRRIGFIVSALIVVAVVSIAAICHFGYKPVIEIGTLLAELAIAVVIYYEIEENRAGHFISDSLGEPYTKRSDLYDKFVDAGQSNELSECRQKFAELLRDQKSYELRKQCDVQLVQFSRYDYMLRRSLLHSGLMISWFPQVLIRLYVMLCSYIDEAGGVGYWQRKEFLRAVLKSVEKIQRERRFIEIYSSKSKRVICIKEDDLKKIKDEIVTKLANKPPA